MAATLQTPPPAGKPDVRNGSGSKSQVRPLAGADWRAQARWPTDGSNRPITHASRGVKGPGICSCPREAPGRQCALHARVERVFRAPCVLTKTRPFFRLCGMSAPQQNTHHMSDNNQSGAPSTTPGAASTGENPGFGVFGANRGSGLARGKRPAPPAASNAAPAAPSGYKPSALEVITTKSEYVNPFTGETAVNAPRANEPAPQAAPAPAPVAAPARTEPVEHVERAPVASAPTFTDAPPPVPSAAPTPVPTAPVAKEADLFPLDAPAASTEKASLNILPTEEPKRPAVSWESSSSAPAAQPQRREDRSTFQPRERRDGRDNPQGREGREGKPFEPREPRRDDRKFEPRDKQPYQPRDPRDERPERSERPERAPRPESPAPAPKSGGFLGWLKGLFGGGKSTETPTTTGGGEQRPYRDGEGGGRRRHRGGRGRGRGGFDGQNRGGGQPFQHRDPRDEEGGESGPGGGDYQQGEHRGGGDGYQGGGGGRRRRRGGRGRFRGEGGGERGPRPEGQQGGGAI